MRLEHCKQVNSETQTLKLQEHLYVASGQRSISHQSFLYQNPHVQSVKILCLLLTSRNLTFVCSSPVPAVLLYRKKAGRRDGTTTSLETDMTPKFNVAYRFQSVSSFARLDLPARSRVTSWLSASGW